MRIYAWISDPHDGENEPYPMAFVHPSLGVMTMFSTHRRLVESDQMREIAAVHAQEHGCRVRLVEAEIVDTIDIIDPNGGGA